MVKPDSVRSGRPWGDEEAMMCGCVWGEALLKPQQIARRKGCVCEVVDDEAKGG
jgi:hypothetical protein